MFLQFLDFFANTGLVSSSNLFSADGLNGLGLNIENGSGLKFEVNFYLVVKCAVMLVRITMNSTIEESASALES